MGEVTATATVAVPKPALSKASPSFRLRSHSLNSVRLRRVFDLFDSNADGEITVDEILQALNLLGLHADHTELAATVSSYFKPGREGLDFDDFSALHRSLGDALFGAIEDDEEEEDQEDEEELKEAFRVFDEDGDGFISAVELQIVLRKLGLPEGGEIKKVENMICSVDRNADGKVDFNEFKHMMNNLANMAC